MRKVMKCSLCGSEGVTKITCPCLPNVKNPSKEKHYNWRRCKQESESSTVHISPVNVSNAEDPTIIVSQVPVMLNVVKNLDYESLVALCETNKTFRKLCKEKGNYVIKEWLKYQDESTRDKFMYKFAEEGNSDLVEFLMKMGTKRTHDMLMIASERGYLDVVKVLAHHIDDINIVLMQGCRFGHFDLVEYAVEKGADVNINLFKSYPIVAASRGGNLEIIKYLESKNANIKKRLKQAMLSAAEGGHLDIMKYLIEKGADINAKFNGKWPLLVASWNNKPNVMRYLIQNGAPYTYTTLSSASFHGHLDIVQDLYSTAQIDLHDTNGALYQASLGGHIQIMKYLIDLGATSFGYAMVGAATSNQLGVAKYLMENYKIKDFSSIIDQTIRFGSFDVFKYLIRKGVKINVETALYDSISNSRLDFVKYLLSEIGGEINQEQLLMAVKHKNIIDYLMLIGVDYNWLVDIPESKKTHYHGAYSKDSLKRAKKYYDMYIKHLEKYSNKIRRLIKNNDIHNLNLQISLLCQNPIDNNIHETREFAKLLEIKIDNKTKQDLCAEIISRLGLFGSYTIPLVQ
jgi:ankyrin repeat protein